MSCCLLRTHCCYFRVECWTSWYAIESIVKLFKLWQLKSGWVVTARIWVAELCQLKSGWVVTTRIWLSCDNLNQLFLMQFDTVVTSQNWVSCHSCLMTFDNSKLKLLRLITKERLWCVITLVSTDPAWGVPVEDDHLERSHKLAWHSPKTANHLFVLF